MSRIAQKHIDSGRRTRITMHPSTYLKLPEQRIDGLGAGDTSLHLNFLQEEVASLLFEALLPLPPETKAAPQAAMSASCGASDVEIIQWQEMLSHGKPVPRLVCIQGESTLDGAAVPMYRHPVDTQPPCHSFSPSIKAIVDVARTSFGHPFNHALIQLYRSGEDGINAHSDKTLDLAHGAPIVNVSLGASREFIIRSKAKLKGGKGAAEIHRVPLVHNSALAFGLETNRKFTHQIDIDKRPCAQRRPDEEAWGGVRISITLRVVATFQRLSDGRLFGLGAPHKSAEALGVACSAGPSAPGGLHNKQQDEKDGHHMTGGAELPQQCEETERARMLEAFQRENHDPDFDWEASYGSGFGVISPFPSRC